MTDWIKTLQMINYLFKKLVLILIFLLECNHISAQDHIMVEVGLQFPYFKARSVTKDEISSSSFANFRGGVHYNIDILKRLSLQPGVFFSGKGGNLEEKDMSGVLKDKITINYLEFPVNVNYTLLNVHDNKLIIGAGPYLAYATSGKERKEIILKGVQEPEKSVEDLKIGNKDHKDVVRPWDYGLNVNAGIQFRWGGYFRVTYCIGLRNIYPTSKPEDFSLLQRAFSVCIGYGLPN